MSKFKTNTFDIKKKINHVPLSATCWTTFTCRHNLIQAKALSYDALALTNPNTGQIIDLDSIISTECVHAVKSEEL